MEMVCVCVVDGLGNALVFWKCSVFVQWKVFVMRWLYVNAEFAQRAVWFHGAALWSYRGRPP
jgi:hypothetical protein